VAEHKHIERRTGSQRSELFETAYEHGIVATFEDRAPGFSKHAISAEAQNAGAGGRKGVHGESEIDAAGDSFVSTVR
jgi:hypothetical protein